MVKFGLIGIVIGLLFNPITALANADFDSLSKVLLVTKDPLVKISTLLSMSLEAEGSSPQQSLQYAITAYELAVEHQFETETIDCLIQLGRSYVRNSDFQKAMENIETALEHSQKSGKDSEIAKAKGVLSLINYELGNYEKSTKLDFENLAYYEEINDQKQIGLTLGNIGIDFISQDNYKKGLEYLQKSFDIALKNNDLHGMAYQYNNIAAVYTEYYQDYRVALGYFKEALRINSSLNDLRQQGIYLMNLGNCYSKLGLSDSVLIYYWQANQIFKKLNNNPLFSECQNVIGEYYFRSNDLSLSLLHADTALNLSLRSKRLENLHAAARLLHKISLANMDTLNAYKFAMMEHQARDSIVEMTNQRDLYKLEFQYNFEKADKARQLARQKKETALIIIVLCFISGFSILLLVYSRQRIRSKNIVLQKESIEKELNFKNKELSINLISLIKKNEMISEIYRKLVTIEKSAKKEETKQAIAIINKELRLSADDKMLREFTLRFQEVHKDFYDSLLLKFPDLSPNELKLCAFLRLNMSTKDISDLTGQRTQTIDHARYRLRKKLGISNSEVNLIAFLHQL